MMLFALAILGNPELQALPPEAAGVIAVAPQIYRRPAVPPYEPPSDFGRQRAEGDADARPRRSGGRADAVTDYQRAVDERRRAAQALMGPLDGLWRVAGADDRTMLELALVDRGAGERIEGAWTRVVAHGGARSGLVQSVSREGDVVRIELEQGAQLDLLIGPDGWRGVLTGDGKAQAVLLMPR